MAGFWDENTELSAPNLNRTTVPAGGIIMFSGSLGDLPDGWVLCDGSNGTPDLRDRFVVGAEGAYSQGSTGGQDAVTLTTAQLPSHSHGAGSLDTSEQSNHQHTTPTATSSSGTQFQAVDAETRPVTSEDIVSVPTSSSGAHNHSVSGSTANAGSGSSHENRPPYYALAFIMRVA